MGDSVFINGRAAVHKGSAGKSIAFPDVCLCPPSPPAGPIPTPLPNTVQAADLEGGAKSVLIEGNPSGKKSSFFKKSTGNEVSRPTGGGVITHAVQGKAYFQTFSMNVMIEGEPAVRHMDLLTHNHLGPQPGNTPPMPWLSTMKVLPAAPKTISRKVGAGPSSIAILVADRQGQPLEGRRYRAQLPDGKRIEGALSRTGQVLLAGLARGDVRFALLPARSPSEDPEELSRAPEPPRKAKTPQIGQDTRIQERQASEQELQTGVSLTTDRIHRLVNTDDLVSVRFEISEELAERLPEEFALILQPRDLPKQRIAKRFAKRIDEHLCFDFRFRGANLSVTLTAAAGDERVCLLESAPLGDLSFPIAWSARLASMLLPPVDLNVRPERAVVP